MPMATPLPATSRGLDTCEIVVCMVSIPIYIGNFLMHTTSISFQAESRSSGQADVIGSPSEADDISQEELSSGVIHETPKRRSMVEGVRRSLESNGWRCSGQAQEWFQLRFSR
jgi:hypothetical protein